VATRADSLGRAGAVWGCAAEAPPARGVCAEPLQGPIPVLRPLPARWGLATDAVRRACEGANHTPAAEACGARQGAYGEWSGLPARREISVAKPLQAARVGGGRLQRARGQDRVQADHAFALDGSRACHPTGLRSRASGTAGAEPVVRRGELAVGRLDQGPRMQRNLSSADWLLRHLAQMHDSLGSTSLPAGSKRA